jgi:hypothetical protein
MRRKTFNVQRSNAGSPGVGVMAGEEERSIKNQEQGTKNQHPSSH